MEYRVTYQEIEESGPTEIPDGATIYAETRGQLLDRIKGDVWEFTKDWPYQVGGYEIHAYAVPVDADAEEHDFRLYAGNVFTVAEENEDNVGLIQ